MDRLKSGVNLGRQVNRFEALDAWRGLCACMVVLFHFNVDVNSHIREWGIITGSYLFVDFFFVLSGFVITGSYQSKLETGFPLKKFILLRLGRIYPLHMFMLLGYVAIECLQFFVKTDTAPFSIVPTSPEAMIANIFLVHGLNTFDQLTWNTPSWSISVEFFTYIIFALAIFTYRNKALLLAGIMTILCPIALVLLKPNMDVNYDYGLIRCLYGFSVGHICFHLYQRYLAYRDLGGGIILY